MICTVSVSYIYILISYFLWHLYQILRKILYNRSSVRFLFLSWVLPSSMHDLIIMFLSFFPHKIEWTIETTGRKCSLEWRIWIMWNSEKDGTVISNIYQVSQFKEYVWFGLLVFVWLKNDADTKNHKFLEYA